VKSEQFFWVAVVQKLGNPCIGVRYNKQKISCLLT